MTLYGSGVMDSVCMVIRQKSRVVWLGCQGEKKLREIEENAKKLRYQTDCAECDNGWVASEENKGEE